MNSRSVVWYKFTNVTSHRPTLQCYRCENLKSNIPNLRSFPTTQTNLQFCMPEQAELELMKRAVPISAATQATLSFRNFPQSPRNIIELYFDLVLNGRFLQNPFKIHEQPNHPKLYRLDTEAVVKCPTKFRKAEP
jgi:hypothetical protein